MSKYLIKLTPYDTFFFGGENTFGEGNEKNYFVKSNYFPQQTSLLGLVRYQLLLQSNNGIFADNKIKDKIKAVKLIGPKSFTIGNDFNFGKIKCLSPVFIINEKDKFLFPANKEYHWIDKDENENEINNFVMNQFERINGNANCSINNKNFIPFMRGYDPKKDLPDLLIDNKNGGKYKYSDIFIEQKQVGIRKNYEGKSEEDAFYVQIFYKLKKGYSFAFILELEDGTNFSDNNLVTLGGEQSKFKMEVIPFTDDFNNLLPNYEQSENSAKIVLISDAYLPNKILDLCDFAITDIVDFRSLVTTVEDTNDYASLDKETKNETKNETKLYKTGKYNFFKRGSVFYIKNENKQSVINLFSENKNLKNIGYNIYKIIEKKK